jgi:dCMP deaminase
MNSRPDWDTYFLGLMNSVSMRSTCDRGRSGCVIVRDRHILSTGYVGSPPGMEHCDDVGHELEETIHGDGTSSMHCVRTIHAEQNAICQAAREGVSIKGATLYCRMTPCRVCAMMIINAGIERVVCERLYQRGAESITMFNVSGVAIQHMNIETQEY